MDTLEATFIAQFDKKLIRMFVFNGILDEFEFGSPWFIK